MPSITDGYSAAANAPAASAGAAAAESLRPVRLTFEQIYSERFHDVLRWLRALHGLDAELEDLAQEVFVVVERRLADFDGRNLEAWLYKIAKNQVSHHRRRAWVRRVLTRSIEPEEVPVHARAEPTPLQALEQRESLDFVTRTLGKMSVSHRSAFVLFEIEGYTGEEIAALEGIPLNTVWTRLYHARKTFFELIGRARVEGRLP